jgi:hypothetical protein
MTQESTNGRSPLATALASHDSLNNDVTIQGIAALCDKLAPLLQGRRLHNVVDLLSALSDVVDLADDALVQKLTRNFEVFSAAAFNLNNTLNHAIEQAGSDPNPPSVWQSIRRINGDADVRRGLAVATGVLAQLGRQARYSAMPMPDD